ncbi:hypothetical protein LSH36_266g04028 [Paralvinella palmiformis]|uniref:Uncharacterized protein n=1 Tax=Paralvinella palmiformis TaxID=53620 RepID=A0AAD9JK63_9ANNE|nr:hypothetical protein LSH36_266g04028 [Paralvinella palmiformis]
MAIRKLLIFCMPSVFFLNILYNHINNYITT